MGAVQRVFQGVIAAIDGAYTLGCRFPEDIQEMMYTGYKKFSCL